MTEVTFNYSSEKSIAKQEPTYAIGRRFVERDIKTGEEWVAGFDEYGRSTEGGLVSIAEYLSESGKLLNQDKREKIRTPSKTTLAWDKYVQIMKDGKPVGHMMGWREVGYTLDGEHYSLND
jgi:hypothetical protein